MIAASRQLDFFQMSMVWKLKPSCHIPFQYIFNCKRNFPNENVADCFAFLPWLSEKTWV